MVRPLLGASPRLDQLKVIPECWAAQACYSTITVLVRQDHTSWHAILGSSIRVVDIELCRPLAGFIPVDTTRRKICEAPSSAVTLSIGRDVHTSVHLFIGEEYGCNAPNPGTRDGIGGFHRGEPTKVSQHRG